MRRWMRLVGMFITALLGPEILSASVTVTGGSASCDSSTFLEVHLNGPRVCECSHQATIEFPATADNPSSVTLPDCPQCEHTIDTSGGQSVTGRVGPAHVEASYTSSDAGNLRFATTAQGGPVTGLGGGENCDTSGSIGFFITGQPESVQIAVAVSISGDGNASVVLKRDGVQIGTIHADRNGTTGAIPSGLLDPGSYSLEASVSADASLDTSPTGFSYNLAMSVSVGDAPDLLRWSSPVSGSFGDAARWDPPQVPNAQQTALFDLSGADIRVSATDATVGRLEIDQMRLALSGSARVEGIAGASAAALLLADGSLVLDGGASLFSQDASIGGLLTQASVLLGGAGTHWSNGTGAILIAGEVPAMIQLDTNAALDSQGPIELSGGSQAMLSLQSGAQVQAPRVTVKQGVVDVRGVSQQASMLRVTGTADGDAFNIGSDDGTGRLVVADGAQVTVETANVGATAVNPSHNLGNSGGDQVILETASTFTARGALTLDGDPGTQIEVKDGSQMLTEGVEVGINATGRITVHDQGSFWSANDLVAIEGTPEHPGELTVEDGGHVDLRAISGTGATGSGVITVSGEGSTLNTQEFLVAVSGHGDLDISGGAKVESTKASVGGAQFSFLPPGLGRVQIESGITVDTEWHVSGDLNVGTHDTAGKIFLTSQGNAFIPLGKAIVTVDGTLTVGRNGVILGNGNLAVSQDHLVINGGEINVGHSPGLITIEGNYEQTADGVLDIEVAGLEDGQFDVLHVTGNATLAGSVALTFIDGFVPKPGESVDFVQVDGTITGKLTGEALVDIPADPSADTGSANEPPTGQPVTQAVVQWEVTPDGTCRMTVTDVLTDGQSTLDTMVPPACGAGLCGAGGVPMLALTFGALLVSRRRRRPARRVRRAATRGRSATRVRRSPY